MLHLSGWFERGTARNYAMCENYRGGGKTTKMAEFMASLVELSHNCFAFRKRAAPKGDELRIFTQPLRTVDLGAFLSCPERTC